jgi:hypothetical protein
LLAADAIFRQVQVALKPERPGWWWRQSAAATGTGGLFELELDKMKNQYETVQRQQQRWRNNRNRKLSGSWKNLRGVRTGARRTPAPGTRNQSGSSTAINASNRKHHETPRHART